MPTSDEIRRQFIDFFVERHGHTPVPSSPVVPHDDPTLLFTNAGMNQFKDVFLGVGDRPYSRAADTQKCIRAGGKHNDLDDVGRDTYHHTFFEMLGNWSFGDYFKREAIEWAWQLLTEVWGLDKSRLHATVFAGDETLGLEPDTEAEQLWREVTDIDPAHITRCGRKENFWEMGDTGPCGPCSEIHIDLTPDKSGAALVNRDDPRVIEIWNLVFIQFNRDRDGVLTPLPDRHVDTGMGFERICAVLQGKTSNYDTDVFTPIFQAIREITETRAYGGAMGDPIDMAYRVLADHARCLTFAIADGALPSNEGRGYVLRRILRRAARYGRQNLNMADPFLHRLVPVIADHMGGVFPELKEDSARIAEVIREEEESFGETLDRGIDLFDQVVRWSSFIKAGSQEPAGSKQLTTNFPGLSDEAFNNLRNRIIPGLVAFRLYDTYGFPLDLTQLMAEERGMGVDVEGFDRLMEEARRRSRGGGGRAEDRESLVGIVQQGDLPLTEFIGYDEVVSDDSRAAEVLVKVNGRYERADTLEIDEPAAVVVETTPFYAEAGGQVGDTGAIHSRHGAVFRVDDTIKIGGVYFHLGQLEEGNIHSDEPAFSEEDSLLLEIDQPRRRKIRALHTATHLLNWALREVLGDHVQQRGSLVDEEKTRFDFSHGRPMTTEEIERVQKLVNDRIAEDLTVHAQTAPQDEAMKINGLRAVFGEKYPPQVRVVSIGVPVEELLRKPDKSEWRRYSIEFCGGTHLASTGKAGRFVIATEEAVAKGVRRIIGLAGEAANRSAAHAEVLAERLEALRDQNPETLEHDLIPLLETLNSVHLPLVNRSRIRDQAAELQKIVKQHHKQRDKQAEGNVIEVARALAVAAEGEAIIAPIAGADSDSLRKAMDVIRQKNPDCAMLLAAPGDDKIAFLAAVPQPLIDRGLKAGDWVREVAKVAGGGGGGRPDMAQAGGKNPAKLSDALETARRFAAEKLHAPA